MTSLPYLLRVFMTAAICGAGPAGIASEIEVVSTDSNYLLAQRIPVSGELVKVFRSHDKDGEYTLILSRLLAPSKAKPDAVRLERIDLQARYLTLRAGAWKEEWTVKDFVDCPGLDSAASFYTDHVVFTDLDKNGIAEVTLPYRMVCGGGIEPATVKVILRQGSNKLAIRGESLIRLPGGASFGGDRRVDPALGKPENSAFRRHLDAVWREVSIDRK